MTLHQVTCITTSNHPDPQQRITHIGGSNSNGKTWRITVAEAISKLLAGNCAFFTISNGHRLNLVIGVNRMGGRYLRCESENGDPVALLALQDCLSEAGAVGAS